MSSQPRANTVREARNLSRHLSLVGTLMGATLFVGGCPVVEPTVGLRVADSEEPTFPAMRGTLGEIAEIRGDLNMEVRGLGLVVGLGGNGHVKMPDSVRARAKKMAIERIKAAHSEGGSPIISAEKLVGNPDTAVVRVWADIPPGCRRGEKFDVMVEALPGTDTKTLEGGRLFTASLQRTGEVGGEKIVGARMADASGGVFVNPAAADPQGQRLAGGDPRLGRVLGGGVNLDDRPILLVLREPDMRNARTAESRINERFQESGYRIAVGRSDYNIQLTIPLSWRDELDHYLDLILHLPVDSDPARLEVRAARLAAVMAGRATTRGLFTLPEGTVESRVVDLERISLAMEAIGPVALPHLRPLLSEPGISGEGRLAAAEAAARLGEPQAAEVLEDYVFARNLPPETDAATRLAWQARALRCVSGVAGSSRAGVVLQRILREHPDASARIAAYEALRRRGDKSIQTLRVVQRLTNDGRVRESFDVDLVPKAVDAPYMIYATQRGQPRLAIFGADLTVSPRVEYIASRTVVNGLPRLRLSRPSETEAVQVICWTRGGVRVPTQTCSARVVDLVMLLSQNPPDTPTEETTGLGFAYSEVVGILRELTREPGLDDRPLVEAEFVLQRLEQDIPRLMGRAARRSETDNDDDDPRPNRQADGPPANRRPAEQRLDDDENVGRRQPRARPPTVEELDRFENSLGQPQMRR